MNNELIEAKEWFETKANKTMDFAENRKTDKSVYDLVKELYGCAGIKKIYIGERYDEEHHIKKDGGEYSATLFIEFANNIFTITGKRLEELFILILKFKPDEVMKENNLLRLWWD